MQRAEHNLDWNTPAMPRASLPSVGGSLLPSGAYQALIFDCDGTLADTIPLHLRAWTESLLAVGAVLPSSWYLARVGVSRGDLLRQFRDEFGGDFDAGAVSDEQMRLFHAGISTVREIGPAANVARSAHRRVPLAVASGGHRAMVTATIDAIGLTPLFDAIVTIEDVRQGKPAPDLFLEAARRLGVSPTGCVVYEDSDEGLEAARQAGMRAVDVRRGLGEE